MASSVYIAQFNRFSCDHEVNVMLSKLHTKQTKFMIPTVLSCFRKGINPVKANYQYMQMALMTDNCKYKSWFLTHIKESNMIADMLFALDEDMLNISKLKQKYKCMKMYNETILMLDKLYNDFYNIKVGLIESSQ